MAISPTTAAAAEGERTAPTGQKRPYLILLRGAPIWEPDSQLTLHAEALSKYFDGEIWFGRSTPYQANVGNFRLRGIALPGFGWRHQFRQLLPAIVADLFARQTELAGREKIFVAYDPLLQGLLGVYLKWRFGGRLLTEFSGVYADLANYERTSGLSAAFRREIFRLVAQFVVLNCSGVRQLFPGQASSFVLLPPGIRQMTYFNAINTSRFEPAPTEKPRRVVLVGTPYWRKGVDVLVEAWKHVGPRHPDWSLTLIGAGIADRVPPEAARQWRIDVPGPMPHHELAETIRHSAILVLPSRSEAMGRVLLEAASAGCARIASRVGGIPQIVEDGVDGLLVEPGDAGALGHALDRLMSDDTLRGQLGEQAHQRMQTEFTGAAYACAMDSFIGRIVAKRADITA